MNPFKSIRHWTRRTFPNIDAAWTHRQIAEEETSRDLQKPVQQLLCDVHEEALNPLPPKAEGEPDEHWNQRLIVLQLQRLIGAQKRMVSLQTVTTFETSRAGDLVLWLTVVIVVQTFVLIWLAARDSHPRPVPSAGESAAVVSQACP